MYTIIIIGWLIVTYKGLIFSAYHMFRKKLFPIKQLVMLYNKFKVTKIKTFVL